MIQKIIKKRAIENKISKYYSVWGSRFGSDYYQIEISEIDQSKFYPCKVSIIDKNIVEIKGEEKISQLIKSYIEENCRKYGLKIYFWER